HQAVLQHLGADGRDGIAIVIALEVAGIDEDTGPFGNAQRKLCGGAIRGSRDQQLLTGGAQRRRGTGGGTTSQQTGAKQRSRKKRDFPHEASHKAAPARGKPYLSFKMLQRASRNAFVICLWNSRIP